MKQTTNLDLTHQKQLPNSSSYNTAKAEKLLFKKNYVFSFLRISYSFLYFSKSANYIILKAKSHDFYTYFSSSSCECANVQLAPRGHPPLCFISRHMYVLYLLCCGGYNQNQNIRHKTKAIKTK